MVNFIIARVYGKDMLSNMCFSKPTNDFDFALIHQDVRFEWLFLKRLGIKASLFG